VKNWGRLNGRFFTSAVSNRKEETTLNYQDSTVTPTPLSGQNSEGDRGFVQRERDRSYLILAQRKTSPKLRQPATLRKHHVGRHLRADQAFRTQQWLPIPEPQQPITVSMAIKREKFSPTRAERNSNLLKMHRRAWAVSVQRKFCPAKCVIASANCL